MRNWDDIHHKKNQRALNSTLCFLSRSAAIKNNSSLSDQRLEDEGRLSNKEPSVQLSGRCPVFTPLTGWFTLFIGRGLKIEAAGIFCAFRGRSRA